MSIMHSIISMLAVFYFFSTTNRKKQKWLFIFACCIILFFSSFRSMAYGYDTAGYVEYFHRFRNMSLSESLKWQFEPGYIILNKVIGYCTDNGQIFLAVMSTLSLVPVFLLTWKQSANPLLSLLVFTAVGNLFSSYAALRQWCAVAVLTLSYGFIEKRRLLPFLFTVALAYTFHQTALFALPLYFLYPIRITRPKLFLCLVLSAVILLLSDQIMQVMNLFARLETGYNQNGGYILLVAYWALVFVIDLFAYPIENENCTKLGFMALLYSGIIQPMCFSYSGFSRIHLYTWFGFAFGIPRLIQYMQREESDHRNIYFMKLVVIAILFAWYWVTRDPDGLRLIL